MSRTPCLMTKCLTYTIPNTSIHFENLDLSFENKCYGLIGDNGVGKTTLLKLLLGFIKPDKGYVLLNGNISYCPQYIDNEDEHTSALEVLGIEKQWEALQRLKLGKTEEKDFDIIDDDWDLEHKIESLLEHLLISKKLLTQSFISLSGGEKTKILLARVMLTSADFILLDEPTNNLDETSKKVLFDWIKDSRNSFIIVSHDRNLLNFMDTTIELTTKGVNTFGGNYDFYEQQKRLLQENIQHQISAANAEIKRNTYSIQTTQEKHGHKRKKGKLLRKQGNVDKLTANGMRGRSEKTQSRNTTIAESRIHQAQENLNAAKKHLEIKASIKSELLATEVPSQKHIISIEGLDFAYPNQEPLFEDFNFSIVGPERVALTGANGCGKTTLLHLIMGLIKPQKGKIERDITPVRFLDQQCCFLNPSLSLVENFEYLNPDVITQEAYAALASMQFRNVHAEKKVANLSGGERIRAGLAMSLLSKNPPQLIALDEPTNHLDLRSINSIEDALSKYRGAMLVISHDSTFLEKINVTRYVHL